MAPKKPPVLDAELDDAYCEGDNEIDYSQVEEVAVAFDAINQIDDPDERKAAARDYFDAMAAESTTGGDI